MKTKPKTSEPGREDAKSEIQRDGRGKEDNEGETTHAAIHKGRVRDMNLENLARDRP